jgi:hypothetical protein
MPYRGAEADLPEIPVFDCGSLGAAHLVEMALPRARRMMEMGRANYTAPLLALADWKSRAWLAKNETPYAEEIDRIAKRVEAAGAHALNVSYEWACTTAAVAPVLLRALDWRFDGLGREIVVARHASPAGPWLNVTWPGFVGVLTGLAPGRFAAALNQAPLRHRTRILPVDWLVDRLKVSGNKAMPAVHLLRLVFETARNFDHAVAMLRDTPIALPALFALSGPDGQAAIVERQERSAIVHKGDQVMANHWLNTEWHGRPRGIDSAGRWRGLRRQMEADGPALGQGFAWLRPPVLNRLTRLAAAMNPATGSLQVVGLERVGDIALPATRTLHLETPPAKRR